MRGSIAGAAALRGGIFGADTTRDEQQLEQINRRTTQLQGELWSAVLAPASAQPTPVIALAVEGMNDVLNSRGYTQAAWWNQIPIAAWSLMTAIAICSAILVGIGAGESRIAPALGRAARCFHCILAHRGHRQRAPGHH